MSLSKHTDLLGLLKRAMNVMERHQISYALAGGLVASLYRSDIRATADIDFLIYSKGNIVSDGKTALKELGFEPVEIRTAELRGGPLHVVKDKASPICILMGKAPEKTIIRVDFLLHTLPWMLDAYHRAQNHLRRVDGVDIPCMTVEDIVLAKIHSFDDNATRFKDLDDLQSILKNKKLTIDWAYVISKLKAHSLSLPHEIQNLFPAVVRRESKRFKT